MTMCNSMLQYEYNATYFFGESGGHVSVSSQGHLSGKSCTHHIKILCKGPTLQYVW